MRYNDAVLARSRTSCEKNGDLADDHIRFVDFFFFSIYCCCWVVVVVPPPPPLFLDLLILQSFVCFRFNTEERKKPVCCMV